MERAPLRIGVVGCGDFGRRHVRRFASLDNVVVAAVADPSPVARAAAVDLVHQLGRPAPESFTSFEELLRVPLDAVCIASPDAYHVPQVLAALNAGLHVLCEKPLTLSLNELEAVLEARARTGKVVCMTYQRRYDPAHRLLRQEIFSGRWGPVQAVSVYNCEDWITPNKGTWRHDPLLCPGGFLYDAAGHQLDFVFWATGLVPVSVQAWKHHAGTPVPIRVWGTALLSGGVPMTFHFVGDADAWREQVNIHCERRDFFVESYKPGATPGKGRDTDKTPFQRAMPLTSTEQPLGCDTEFIAIIEGKLPNPAPPEDTRPVVQFTSAALRSAALGRPVLCEP